MDCEAVEVCTVETEVESSDDKGRLIVRPVDVTRAESSDKMAERGREGARGKADEGTTRGGAESLLDMTTEVGAGAVETEVVVPEEEGRPRANAIPFLAA